MRFPVLSRAVFCSGLALSMGLQPCLSAQVFRPVVKSGTGRAVPRAAGRRGWAPRTRRARGARWRTCGVSACAVSVQRLRGERQTADDRSTQTRRTKLKHSGATRQGGRAGGCHGPPQSRLGTTTHSRASGPGATGPARRDSLWLPTRGSSPRATTARRSFPDRGFSARSFLVPIDAGRARTLAAAARHPGRLATHRPCADPGGVPRPHPRRSRQGVAHLGPADRRARAVEVRRAMRVAQRSR